jgi:transketolase
MAIASQWMAAHFNRPGFEMFDFDVYALAGDGCMMEGSRPRPRRWPATSSSQPVLDLRQQPDHDRGPTDLAFSEDVATRFIAYGWNVTRVGDANDLEMLERALQTFKKTATARR